MRTLLPLTRQQLRDALAGDRGWLVGVMSGLLLVLVLTGVKLLFIESIGYPTPFLLYFAAILVATYRGGVVAGHVTTLTCVVVSYFLFTNKDPEVFFFRGATALAVFAVEGFCIALVTGGFVVERRKAQQAIDTATRVQAQLELVLSGVDEGITLQDATGRTLYANPVAAQMAGCSSPEEFVSLAPAMLKDRFEFFDSAGNPFPPEEIPGRRLLRGKTAPEVRLRVRRTDTGAEHWALLRSNALRNDQGEVEFVVSVFRDVSGSRQKEAELRLAREWFQIALRSIGDAVITTDSRGRINLLNPVAEALTGWQVDDALGRPLKDVFPIISEDTREPVESPVARVLREGVVVGLSNHTLLLRKDGSEVAIDDSAAPIRDSEGQLEGVILVFRDVTAKRSQELRSAFLAKATQELNSSLDYRTTLSTVARLAVPTVADWCAVDILEDERVVRLGVAHVDEAKVRHVEELQRRYPSDPDSPGGVHDILRTGKPLLMPEIPQALLEGSARDEDHKRLILELGLHSYMAVPLERDGRPFGVITFATAESKKTFTEADLELAVALADRASLAVENARLFKTAEQARQQAEAANRTKDEFLAMLGHELRNPLSPISSALALMTQAGDTGYEREIRVIERQVKHLVRLVDDLLDVARITKGRVDLNCRRVAVAQVMARAKEMVWPETKEPPHQLVFDVEPGLELTCDPLRVAQVIANLLNNSIKYTPEGGHIWVHASGDADGVSIVVRDDGMGIGEPTLKQVFDLFVQEPQALDRAQGGLGVGLAIVKGLVAAHGGSVSAKSEGLGQGAEFVVHLPYGDASQLPSRPSPVDASRVSPRRILVVDDNADAAELLTDLLRQEGHEAVLAFDGPSALRVAQEFRPELALLDVGLPGMNGYELGQSLRRVEGLERIELIATTGYGQPEDHRRSSEAGFLAHLVKPVAVSAIDDAIASLTNR